MKNITREKYVRLLSVKSTYEPTEHEKYGMKTVCLKGERYLIKDRK